MLLPTTEINHSYRHRSVSILQSTEHGLFCAGNGTGRPHAAQLTFNSAIAPYLETLATMEASTLGRLLIAAACVLQIRASHAAAAASSQSSTSYQPTPGVEGKWVAEEEFYGASDITNNHNADFDNGDHAWWDEDDESEAEEESIHPSEYSSSSATKENVSTTEKRRRWRRNRKSKQQNEEDQLSSSLKRHDRDVQSDKEPSSQYDEEHPMRTDEWALDIHLSRLFSREEGDELFPECYTDRDGRSNTKPIKKNRYRKRQVMTFATNGYVKVSVNDNDNNNSNSDNDRRIDTASSSVIQTLRNKPRVGKWRIGHSGVAFDIPVQMSVSRKNRDNNGSSKVKEPKMTVLHYHADMHLNKFGERPRMFRGVITRDRYDNFCATFLVRMLLC